jgi:hypothetical protein
MKTLQQERKLKRGLKYGDKGVKNKCCFIKIPVPNENSGGMSVIDRDDDTSKEIMKCLKL